MQRPSLRAVLAVGLGGCASLAAVRRRKRRRALTAEPDAQSPPDPPDSHLAEDRMDILGTGEGMPETG